MRHQDKWRLIKDITFFGSVHYCTIFLFRSGEKERSKEKASGCFEPHLLATPCSGSAFAALTAHVVEYKAQI